MWESAFKPNVLNRMIVPHDLFYNVEQFPAADASGSWEMLRGAPWLQPCAAEHWSKPPEEVALDCRPPRVPSSLDILRCVIR